MKTPIFIFSGKSPLSSSGGGYSTYSYNLARLLKKLGYSVYILALGEKNKIEKTNIGTLITQSARIPFLNVNIYALPGLPFYGFVFANTVKTIVIKKNIKKLIVWGIGPWGFAAFISKLILGSRTIHINNYFTTTKHEWWGGVKALRIVDYGIWPKLKYLTIYLTVVQYLSFLEKLVLKSADVIITNYRSTEEILKKQFSIEKSKFYRAHFYVKVYKREAKEDIKTNSIKLPKKFLFFFSRQDPRKGVNYLLRSQRILIDRGYKIPLLIGGGGDMLLYNKRLAENLNITKYIKFLGFVNDPKPLMKNCTMFIFPSVEEGAGALTVNEAMEMGLPIVTTACDGIMEDIIDKKSGILVSMADPNSLADGIISLLNNPKFAKKLGIKAKASYNKNFSFQRMEKDIKKLMVSLESK